MKKIFNYIFAASMVLGLASCDKLFDSLEGDLSKMYAEDLTATEDGIDRLLAALYPMVPMNPFGEQEKSTPHAGESSGDTNYSGGVSSFWDYTAMRDINSFIKQITLAKERGAIRDEAFNNYLGEAKFIRAYCYFGSVRRYGGVPIVTEMLDDQFEGDDSDNPGLYVARSTEKETWDFILKELTEAAELLPSERAANNYRATKWSALGLKSRVALWAASVSKYWNRAAIASSYKAVGDKLAYMEASYANAYYQQCIDASEQIIKSGKFSLYMPTPANAKEAAENYAELFQSRHNEEFIFGRSYNNGVVSNSNGIDLKNSPNQIHGSGTGVWKFGCYGVTLDMVDTYDNYDASGNAVDGTVKTLKNGEIYFAQPHNDVGKAAILNSADDFVVYDEISDPFKNKDARFQASVIYPGVSFRNTEIVIQAGLWESASNIHVLEDILTPISVGGKNYYRYGASSESYFSGFYKRGNTNDGSWYTTGFGLRKFLNPTQSVDYSQNPWYDIRYAEILLNYCEAQVEMNGTNAGDSKKYLNQIRRRAAFMDQRDATLENVLHEREVELAFEDDYPRTLYRRRAFFNEVRDAGSNPNAGRKHALLPILDLRSGSPKYIFIRSNWFSHDTDRRSAKFNYDPMSYYDGIPSHVVNDITPNPSQE